jgi:nucleoside-diphosphate-sugar epimerase
VEATFRVANQVTGCQIVNVSNNSEYSIASLGQAIAELTGTSSPVGLVDAPSGRYDFEVERRCGSSEKLQRLTGFSPSTPLREGLQKVYDYLLSH